MGMLSKALCKNDALFSPRFQLWQTCSEINLIRKSQKYQRLLSYLRKVQSSTGNQDHSSVTYHHVSWTLWHFKHLFLWNVEQT